MGLNVVTLMGRLTADPELRTTPGGVSVSTFRIAVDRSFSKEERKAEERAYEKQQEEIRKLRTYVEKNIVTRPKYKGTPFAL